MAHQPFRPDYPFTSEKLRALRQLVPEAFEDGKLNFATLRDVLTEPDPDALIEDDGERFGLVWPGKQAARRLAAIPSAGTLAPVYGEGLKADGTPDTDGHNDSRNVFIEGENLEVLKILQKAYAGRVKMIYIDPPYNTGNDFVYDDNFTEPLEHYLRRTGQIDEEGQKLTTNTRADGRFHSKWLSMMYPRLRLARNLLREDGVIFVSIDDNEVHNLRQLMNEVFGEENFITNVIWQKVYSPKNTAKYFSEDHDYILVYARNAEIWRPNLMPRSEEALSRYTNRDDDPRGPWKSGDLTARNYYSKGSYEVVSPSGKKFTPTTGTYYRVSPEKFKELDADNRIWWGENGDSTPAQKQFLSEVKSGVVPQTLWTYGEVGHTQEAKKELLATVNFEETANMFNTIKPTRLLERILHLATDEGSDQLVVDFFSGSGSLAHAVLKRNLTTNSNLKFVAVQLPVDLPQPETILKRINDIGYQRVIEYGKSIAGELQDTGFRRFDLADSQLVTENVSTVGDLFGTNKTYDKAILLWEILLQEGFPLDSRLAAHPELPEVTIVTSDFHDYRLLVCLVDDLSALDAAESLVARLALARNDVFVCLDRAVDDQTKLRLSERGMIKTI